MLSEIMGGERNGYEGFCGCECVMVARFNGYEG